MIKQPNSWHCFVCGVENPYGLRQDFFETAPGEITVETIVSDRYQGYPGVVHNGIVASLVDEALGRVHMGPDPQNPRFMYTAKLSAQYRKPVPTNQSLRIVAHAVKNKKHSATSIAEINGPEGTLLAAAEAVLINVPEKTLSDVDLDSFRVGGISR